MRPLRPASRHVALRPSTATGRLSPGRLSARSTPCLVGLGHVLAKLRQSRAGAAAAAKSSRGRPVCDGGATSSIRCAFRGDQRICWFAPIGPCDSHWTALSVVAVEIGSTLRCAVAIDDQVSPHPDTALTAARRRRVLWHRYQHRWGRRFRRPRRGGAASGRQRGRVRNQEAGGKDPRTGLAGLRAGGPVSPLAGRVEFGEGRRARLMRRTQVRDLRGRGGTGH
jgi:hypothetical protein